MSVTDVMSYESLTLLPQAALVIFLLTFAAVSLRTFRRGGGAEHRAAAQLPLVDDSSPKSID
ncbi:MAG: cbb3-type cytochrome c oxidase subunit 3 [Phycisphaerales bacterium]|nr:cbb3-type cytochrome c oxidase subunit 3 [Phycisphaerales bacterium]